MIEASVIEKVERAKTALRKSNADMAAVEAGMGRVRFEAARRVEDAKRLVRDLSRVVGGAASTSSTSDAKTVETRRQAAAQRLAVAQAERDELVRAAERPDAMAHLEHAVSLYENITRVRWTSENGGVVIDPRTQSARQFTLPDDDWDSTNRLWRMLED